jgi:transposase-like protein
MTMPRAARAPHTSKVPEACPHCGGRALTRRGTRKKKFEIVQLWRCASCKRMFTPAPAALRNKTYPLRVIIDALTTYSLGYSHEETLRRMKAKTGRVISDSTLSGWIAEHNDLMSYRRLRDAGRRRFPPEQTVRSIKLYHRQVYRYAFHRPKLEMLRESEEHQRFAPLANFLEAIPLICPHALFRTEDTQARASQAQPSFADVARIIVNRKENAATRAAALVIPTVGDNRRRHDRLQQFMLANDSVTLAVEVPIWLTAEDIAALEKKYGIELGSRVITGHLDFLQVRNGAVHILDYKPDARTNKPIAQLAIYALALTRLVPGLKLFDIKCAWFNEEEYCEIFPRTLFAKKRG